MDGSRTVELALSGHMHVSELLSFTDHRSPQLIVGNGGTLLDHKIKRPLGGQKVGGTTVSYGRAEHSFGYTMLTPARDGTGWMATFLDTAGTAKFSCMLKPAEASCTREQ
jgi:hypothetical protein